MDLWNIFKTLNSAQRSWQVALAISFALISAFLPLFSFINLFILIIIFSINIPISIYFLFITLFSLLAMFFGGIFHSLGNYVLNMNELQDIWTAMYNYAPTLWSSFNYTSIMGGFTISVILFLPVFFLFKFLVDKYRVALSNKFKNSKWFSWLNPLSKEKENEKVGIFRLWGGILVIFIISIFVSFFLLILDPVIKYSLEYILSKSTNLVVNVEGVNSNIANTSFVIKKINIYEDNNVISINNILVALNGKHLIHKKIDIETLSFGNIIFREINKLDNIVISNKIKKEEKDNKEKFNINLPKIDDILAKEDNLKSIKEAKKIKKDIQRIKTKWANINNDDKYNKDIAKIKEQISQLEKEVKNIKSLNDVKNIASKAKEIGLNIKSLKSNLDNLYKDYKKDKIIIEKHIKSLKTLPSKDFNNLKNKYSFNSNGAINLIETHLSNQVGGYMQVALKYYKIIEPYIQSDEDEDEKKQVIKGEWITYKEKTPYPSFVIRNTNASLNIKKLKYSLDIKDISNDQKVYKKIMKAKLVGQDKKYKKLVIKYEHNILNKESLGTLTSKIDSYKISSYKVGNDLIMKDLIIDSKSLGYIKGLKKIDFNMNTNIKKVIFEYKKSSSNVDKSITSILKNIHSFDVNLVLKGNINSPSININSNLDRKISTGLSTILDKEKKKFEKKLKIKLQEKLKKYTGDIDISSFNSIENVLKAKINKGSDLNTLLSKIKNNNKLKNQLKNKIKEGIGKALKSFF
jgi:uncharacterized protein (TIGR03545 family)/uncharacterized protein (TIGR03546 family)